MLYYHGFSTSLMSLGKSKSQEG